MQSLYPSTTNKAVSGIGKVIVITSGKGGTGKTTTTAAVASCLAALGHKTLAVDCDIGLRNLDVSLSMSDFAGTDFLDVVDERVELSDAVHEHPSIENLFFLSAPATTSAADIDAEKMADFVAAARDAFDFTLLDCPAGIGTGFRLAAQNADTAVIVSTSDVSSIRDASVTAQQLADMELGEIRLLINRYNRRRAKQWRETVDDLIDSAGAQLIGIVREDISVPDAVSDETPLILYSGAGAAQDFLATARRLAGEELPI